MKTYKVSFDLSGVISHIGADIAGIGVEKVTEWVHSDTLFSAIIHAYAKKFDFDPTKELIEGFDETKPDIPFHCSSAFLAKDDLLFVPKPKMSLPDGYDWSELFKVKFVSFDNLKQWLGITPTNWNENTCSTFIKSVIDNDSTYKKLFINRVRAVNAKDRLRNQTQVYHRGETVYAMGTQLYFFLEVNEAYEDKLKDAIQFLTDFAGLGGEINIGFSKMNSVSWQPFTLPTATGKNQAYLLSLYPIYPEIDWQNSWYDVINRKSWFNSPFSGVQMKKQAVKMIAEGSCLPALVKKGELLDVSPKEWLKEQDKAGWHRIYRNGYAYFLNY